MKKLLSFLVIAGGLAIAWKKFNEANADRDLWAEVTDAVK